MKKNSKDRRRWEQPWQYRRRRIGTAKKMLARAMRKSGHTYREISEALDISVGAINYILRQEGPEAAKLTREIGERAVARYRLMSEHILSRISDSDMARATLKSKVIAAAILADKAMLAERALSEQKSEHAPEPNFDNITES